jgi:hypothetical protein
MKFQIRLFSFFAITSLFFSANARLPLEIDGQYVQKKPCVCFEYSEENHCSELPLAVQSIGNYSIGGTLSSVRTGETVVDPQTGKKHDVTVWLYPLRKQGKEFRVRQIDQLEYVIKQNENQNGFNFVVKNLSVKQPNYQTGIVIPKDQNGGVMDGPADIKTVVTPTQLIHNNVERRYTAGDESAGPPVLNPIPGVIVNQAFFQIEKRDLETIVLTQIYNNRIEKAGFPTNTYHYDYLSCELKKK